MTKKVTAAITAVGGYVPPDKLTNADLEKMVDTTDEWIVQRTGIRERRIAALDESSATMAIAAARAALEAGGIDPATVDGVVVATSTPDQTFPSVAVKVQAALGLRPGPALDVQAACAGFVYALGVANGMVVSGQCRRVLVVGAEKMTSILNWQDRATCVLFGDGAGAVLLEAGESTGAVATGRTSRGARCW